jgi:hypothetical protein
MSTTTAGSSQNDGGAPHQSPLREPSPLQVIQGDVEFDQIQVQDWDEEAAEDKATEEELARF